MPELPEVERINLNENNEFFLICHKQACNDQAKDPEVSSETKLTCLIQKYLINELFKNGKLEYESCFDETANILEESGLGQYHATVFIAAWLTVFDYNETGGKNVNGRATMSF